MRRIVLLIVGLLWYIVTVTFIVGFVKQLVSGELFSGDDFIGTFVLYYFATWLLGLWQAVFAWLTAKLYDGISVGNWGGSLIAVFASGHIVTGIIILLLSPIILIWHLFATLKPMWWLIRYSPE